MLNVRAITVIVIKQKLYVCLPVPSVS